MQIPNEDEMYQALLERDSSFEGIFIAGVKTTGIFCRPTCTAKKPKKENTVFFRTTKEALDHGYRACKICHPMQPAGVAPQWLKDLLLEIHANPAINMKDQDLRNRGLDPKRVRRSFQKNHGMTFHAYQRSVRLNHAFSRLQEGDKVIDTAYNVGYESLSGFGDAFKKNLGFSPTESSSRCVITIVRITTPLGPLIAGATEEGICLLEFSDRRMLETQIQRLRKHFDARFIPGRNHHLDQLEKQLAEYFNGTRCNFNLEILFPGTAFQRKVWQELLTISLGTKRSYAEQAIAIGHPYAVRAVAKANGDNRIAIIIPCHRVIGSDGKLTGYGGGLWRKKWLLDHESKMNC
ncbi:MAG: methylated-DNA--[protein]-cysteine S-methyltransferase [Saprospiraceae bacterium]|nr:methylated-DNA--[protein]-cysteine S-methyltransferase [Saprospiraceae bacterium]